jgi:DNA sulfur modification protein DndD
MFISDVRLVNWRSYQDVVFSFPEPGSDRSLVLIGAMNGHGKTSMLLGLYFGIFGRFGTRYAEGFQVGKEERRQVYYRKALQAFRRRGSDYDDPTEVHVTFKPTALDPDDAVEFRIHRRWYFSSSGHPRDNGYEEVSVFVNGVPQRIGHLDDAQELIESHLFPAHVLPAFFFDGEQAQRRVEESGNQQMRQAVEVLYGTKILDELRGKLGDYVGRCKKDMPSTDGRDLQRIDLLRAERDTIESELVNVQQQIDELTASRADAGEEFEAAQRRLELLGVSSSKKIERISERLEQARRNSEERDREVNQLAKEIALPLALRRFSRQLVARLDAEEKLEEWEALRLGTESKMGLVMSHAFPDPDPLLAPLPPESLPALKRRFRTAIESIYQPPPDGCADSFRHGHLRGKARDVVRSQIEDTTTLGAAHVESVAKQAKAARDELKDAQRRQRRQQGLPEEVEQIRQRMEAAQYRLAEVNSALGSLGNQQSSIREDLKQKRAEIGRLETDIARMAPAQRKIEVVNRVRDVLSDFTTALAPLAMKRLEASVTTHFRAMADERYSTGTIRFKKDGNPALECEDQDIPIATMSGFERRTFGIAFSLALAEVSGFRAPLVIDTPLGNADSNYRMSLLEHIVNADLDQIIILTHDEEVVGPYHEKIRDQVAVHYLVKYEPTGEDTGESFVYQDQYFEER